LGQTLAALSLRLQLLRDESISRNPALVLEIETLTTLVHRASKEARALFSGKKGSVKRPKA
jgi:signal transduction histidine kinase